MNGQVASFLALSTVRMATPLLLAALGGLYSERSGVVNIALEGLMLAGAFTAAVVTHFAHQPWLGLAAAVAAGGAVALVHATAAIRFGADQVVSGAAINILFLGLPPLLSGALFASTSETPQIPRGELLPRAPVVLAALLVPLTWYVLERTRFGLRLRAAGENPEAVAGAGLSVERIRYVAVMASGALAAIGGAYLAIGQASQFTRNMTAGRGFIALAALIFGKWRPLPTMFACLLFGLAEAVAIQMQGATAVPVQLVQAIPYVLTLVVLAGFIGQARPPRSLGLPLPPRRRGRAGR
ncbi:MAG: ABC transporter permease [Acidobacteria bacterium]|nr:ABC transporter permease [Acidobacteriota bacterium]